MSLEIKNSFVIEKCDGCRFFSETEDGDCWCVLYQKSFELDEDDCTFKGKPRPAFCKANEVAIVIQK